MGLDLRFIWPFFQSVLMVSGCEPMHLGLTENESSVEAALNETFIH